MQAGSQQERAEVMVVVEADRLGGPTFVTYVRLAECVHLTDQQISPGQEGSLGVFAFPPTFPDIS